MKKSELKQIIKECINEMTLSGYRLHFKIPFNMKDEFKRLTKESTPWGARFNPEDKTWNVMFKNKSSAEEFIKKHPQLKQYFIKDDVKDTIYPSKSSSYEHSRSGKVFLGMDDDGNAHYGRPGSSYWHGDR